MVSILCDMADSTEDLRREMEEFEKSENSEVATGVQVPGSPARRTIPTWVYLMLVVDLLIGVAVVLALVVL